MADLELHMEDDVMSHIDLDGFFGDLPEAWDVIGACSSMNAASSSLDSGLSWFDEIENIGSSLTCSLTPRRWVRGDSQWVRQQRGAWIVDGGVDAAKVDGAKGDGEAYDPASKKLRRYID
ncbi:hypothetical protein ACJRO7_028319 [Eucalyptus globulus]|uniref:Uncharacterized protein n=1 Tax=Eucalyptus globulus TaxID=34317 RepID=A0ABD3K003_EUCGL